MEEGNDVEVGDEREKERLKPDQMTRTLLGGITNESRDYKKIRQDYVNHIVEEKEQKEANERPIIKAPNNDKTFDT